MYPLRHFEVVCAIQNNLEVKYILMFCQKYDITIDRTTVATLSPGDYLIVCHQHNYVISADKERFESSNPGILNTSRIITFAGILNSLERLAYERGTKGHEN